MKKLIFIFCGLFCGIFINAQVYSNYYANRNAFLEAMPLLSADNVENIPKIVMPTINVEELVSRDSESELSNQPFEFGVGFDVNYSLEDGVWSESNDKRIWNLRFKSEGAYSLNFIFSELKLVSNAELYIYSTDGQMVYGPVTDKQNIPNNRSIFLTDLVAGNDVTIRLIEPITPNTSSLRITKVVHAYVDMFNATSTRGTIYSCHNDVACFPAWDTESNGVALVLLSSGTSQCTGSLLNNTAQDYRPFFLTAFHCIDETGSSMWYGGEDGQLSAQEISDAENWAFKFKYKKTACNGNVIYKTVTYNYATFRAASFSSDFALMELNNEIRKGFSFLGWDRSGTSPTSGTCIHHPQGEVMKISFDNHKISPNKSSLQFDNFLYYPAQSHWVVGLDNGTVENVSSGSPLFDQNKRVVGQLHGGYDGCPPVTAYYGRLYTSWTGDGTNSTRLSNWLNPTSSSATTLNTLTCPTSTLLLNQNITTNTTIVRCSDINIQNMTIQNGAKLTIETTEKVTINGNFKVELGSKFEIK